MTSYLFEDGPLPQETADEVHRIARSVNVSRFDRGLPVLVHCQMGLNRSGLVAAIALIDSGEAVDVNDALRTLRRARSKDVLCNPDFVAYLRQRYG
jgi:protein-tyrosine phosphatase